MYLVAAAAVGLIHIYIFCMESLWWGREKVNKTFRVKPENVEVIRQWAFNQGFYNLFLALGVFLGSALIFLGSIQSGQAILDFAVASVFFAGLVLAFSTRKIKSSLIQSGPAAIYFVLRLAEHHW